MQDAQIKYRDGTELVSGDAQGKGGIYNFVTKRGTVLVHARRSPGPRSTGSAITWKYRAACCAVMIRSGNLFGRGDQGSPAGRHRHQMIHLGRNTRSTIVSKGISAGDGQQAYCGLVRMAQRAENARNHTQCDSLLIGDRCAAHTFPTSR